MNYLIEITYNKYLYLLYQQEKIIKNNFKFLIIKAEYKLVEEKGIHGILLAIAY